MYRKGWIIVNLSPNPAPLNLFTIENILIWFMATNVF